LGPESGDVVLVTQLTAFVPTLVTVQPAGSVGAVTPSKLSSNPIAKALGA
jgi:hypothetical protein